MGTPVEFISYVEASRTFKVNDEAQQILRSIETPVGVIAISGKSRQGKSYVLNQLLGSNGAFKVASTHRPCTKGLWLWSKPIPRSARDGTNFHLVLLDTEGIDAFDQTGRYSTQVFCLAVLLSSLFVYNQMGPIDESSLNQISLVAEMAKNVQLKADGPSGAEELQAFSPSFLWLLRDFYLDLVDGGEELTPKDYLEIALEHVAGHGPEVDAKNQLRDSIKSLFPERDCCTLVRPAANEVSLTQLDSLPQSELRPEFIDGIQNLLRVLNEKTKPKKLGNTLVSGIMLSELTEAYVEAINRGAVPAIATAWMSVAESETRRAADKAEQKYDNEFDKSVQLEDEILCAEHQRCIALAQMVFDANAFGDESAKKPHQETLINRLKSKFENFRRLKTLEASAQIDNYLRQAAAEIVQSAATMSACEFHHHLLKFVEGFDRQFVGSAKWERITSFMLHNAMPILVQKAADAERNSQSVKDAHQKALDELQRKKENEDQARQLELKFNELMGCHSALMQQTAQDKVELENIRVQLQRTMQEKQQTESALNQAQAQLNSMNNEKSPLAAMIENLPRAQQESLSKAVQQFLSDPTRTVNLGSQEDAFRAQSSVPRQQQAPQQLWERCLHPSAPSPIGGQQRSSWDDSMCLRMQLNEKTQALRAAQDRIRQLEENGPNGSQFSTNNTPQRNSMFARVPEPVGTPSAPPQPMQASPEVPLQPKIPAEEVEKMTIAQLKSWLTDNNYGDVVWESQKGANPRKADWIRMVKERLQ